MEVFQSELPSNPKFSQNRSKHFVLLPAKVVQKSYVDLPYSCWKGFCPAGYVLLSVLVYKNNGNTCSPFESIGAAKYFT